MYTTQHVMVSLRVCLPHEIPKQKPHPVAYVAKAMYCFYYGLCITHDDDWWLSQNSNQSDPFI